jgi:hypothetical protein
MKVAVPNIGKSIGSKFEFTRADPVTGSLQRTDKKRGIQIWIYKSAKRKVPQRKCFTRMFAAWNTVPD